MRTDDPSIIHPSEEAGKGTHPKEIVGHHLPHVEYILLAQRYSCKGMSIAVPIARTAHHPLSHASPIVKANDVIKMAPTPILSVSAAPMTIDLAKYGLDSTSALNSRTSFKGFMVSPFQGTPEPSQATQHFS